MPKLKEIEYRAAFNETETIVKVKIPMELYESLTEEEVNQWLFAILMSCPAYEEKKDLGNQAYWETAELVAVPTAPF